MSDVTLHEGQVTRRFVLDYIKVCPSPTLDPKTELCEKLGKELSKYPQQHWKGVYESGKPCALMCSSQTSVQHVQLADTVPDGTWCQRDGRAVCIGHQCVVSRARLMYGVTTS